MSVLDYIIVEIPKVDVNVDCPEVVGTGNFTVDVFLVNNGNVEANLNIDIENKTYHLTLKNGESRLIRHKLNINKTNGF